MLHILERLLAMTDTISIYPNKNIVIFSDNTNVCPVLNSKVAKNMEVSDYVEFIRMSMKRYIFNTYLSQYGKDIPILILDHDLQNRVNESINGQPLNNYEQEKLVQSVYDSVKELAVSNDVQILLPTFIVLARKEIRRILRTMLEKEFPSIIVLSFDEFDPNQSMKVRTILHSF
jgi:type III secretory pathway component EscV